MLIKFINHASYLIETQKTLLLHDPWLEGNAFNNGWSLLSKEYKNEDLVNYLYNSGKSINIWISHEHGDHFSIPFIKSIKAKKIDCKFYFQKTADRRVLKFLKANKFNVIECIDGKEYQIEEKLSLSVYPFGGGDAFCFLRSDKKNILNINDCVIDNEKIAKKTLSRLPAGSKVDVLFTQFGYANWIGREEDRKLRSASAIEKFRRIQVQNKIFNPEVIIPFASFIYFCKQDNYYLNDEQNSPKKMRESSVLENIQDKINFMRPMQNVVIDGSYIGNLQKNTKEAEDYWNNLISLNKSYNPENYKPSNTLTGLDEIITLGNKFVSKVNNETLGIVSIIEKLKLLNLKPVSFNIYDLKTNVSLSYADGIKECPNNKVSISIHSSEFAFILKNDFGWNTLSVSGAFRATRNEIDDINYFFRWQDAIKNGFSWKNPLHTLKVSIKFFHRLINT